MSIGGTSWKLEIPDEDNIKNIIEKLIKNKEISATEKAINIMLFVMRSQMFYDGNKRTAQLIANKIMIENGAGVIAVPIEKQRDFLEMLVDFYETNDNLKITDFIYNNCIDGANSI